MATTWSPSHLPHMSAGSWLTFLLFTILILAMIPRSTAGVLF